MNRRLVALVVGAACALGGTVLLASPAQAACVSHSAPEVNTAGTTCVNADPNDPFDCGGVILNRIRYMCA